VNSRSARHVGIAEVWSEAAILQQAVGELSKQRIVAEHALRNTNVPMGVAEHQLVEWLPKELETSLPSIEQIERELAEGVMSTIGLIEAWHSGETFHDLV